MAQLKDSIVQGSLRVTDTLYTNDISIAASKTAHYVLAAPTANGAPTFRALDATDIPAISITGGTSGTLPVNRGGTGVATITANSILISGANNTAAITTRAIQNNTTTNATVTANTNIPTMNTIYNALGKINNADQTHAVQIYAPTTGGTAGYILTATGATTAPVWSEILPVGHGGTGVKTITANSILVSGANNTAAITTRTIQNNTTTNATVTANTNIPTMNTVYNALAKINNADQTHAVSIYAATAAGTSGQYLKSTAGTPTWETFSNATVGLGNVSNDSNINSTTGAKGDMIYWSAANTSARLTIGSANQILKVVSGIPSWQKEYEVEIVSLI